MSSCQCLALTPRRLINTKLVRPAGLEPARPKARDFKSRASKHNILIYQDKNHYITVYVKLTV